jgi:hypothetical protein
MMAAGSVVSFGSKSRVPQLASLVTFVRSSGKYRTHFYPAVIAPYASSSWSARRFSFVFILHILALEPPSRRCATAPEAGPLRPFLRCPPVTTRGPFYRPQFGRARSQP